MALVHDYLAERGGAERVVVALSDVFVDAPIYTSVYEADRYPELAGRDVRPSALNQLPIFRRWYRASLPLLPATFGRLNVDADVVLCSSSGWSHGVGTDAAKIVYCYNPARWLYQRKDYAHNRKRYLMAAAAFGPYLRRWDQKAAGSCERYIAISAVVAERIKAVYGVEAEVLPPPVTLDPLAEQRAVAGLEPGFVLAVGRLLGYKNVAEVVEAFRLMPDRRLVVIGDGPQRPSLEQNLPTNVLFLGRVTEPELRWAYANSSALVSASHEDFGLTPIEAALFGKPAVVLRAGGFLDTTIEGVTGEFFEQVDPWAIAACVRRVLRESWSVADLKQHGKRYSIVGFSERLREIVDETVAGHS